MKKTIIKIMSSVMTIVVTITMMLIPVYSIDDIQTDKENLIFEKYAFDDAPDVVYDALFSSESIPFEIINYESDDLYSISTANTDGTTGLYIFETPVKYIEDNTVKIKKNIIHKSENEKYPFEIIDNSIKTKFPINIDERIEISYNDYKVEFNPSNSCLFSKCTDDSIIYLSEDNITYKYSPVLGGLKEDIIIPEYTGVNEISFEIKMDNLIPTQESGLSIPLAAKDSGEVQLAFGQVYIADSSDKEYSFNNELLIEKSFFNTYTLTIILDREYLEAEDTVYPITVDPTITITASNMYDAPVYSGKPNNNYYTNEYNMVGYHNSTLCEAETFVKLNTLATYKYINPEKISSVNYHVYEGSGKTSSATIKIYDTDTTWDGNTITYNNKPGTYSSAISSITINSSTWYNFNIKALFKSWLQYTLGENGGFSPNFGFCMKASSTGQSSRHFCSANNTSYPPSMIITYSEDTSLLNGTYYIRSKYSSLYVTSNDNLNVNQQSFNGDLSQHWTIQYIGNGYYKLKSEMFDCIRSIDVQSNPESNGSNIDVYSTSSTTNDILFKIVSNNDGSYRILSKSASCLKGLDVCGPSLQSGANIQLWDYLGVNQQKWIFEKVNDKNLDLIGSVYAIAESYDSDNALGLTVQYVRSRISIYTGSNWEEVAGNLNSDFNSTVDSNVNYPINSHQFLYYNGHRIDFSHMCATMNAIIYDSDSLRSTAVGENVVDDLAGWAGDLQTLVIDTIEYTENSDNESVFYNSFLSLMGDTGYSFSNDDLFADLDAIYFLELYENSTRPFDANLELYYQNNSQNNISHFLANRTDTELKSDFYFYTRNKYTRYNIDVIQWPIYSNAGYTITTNQANAAARAFADYILDL